MAALLNDAASEMVAPLWPVFVTGALGASPLVVGLIEGLAETAAGLLRVWGGVLLDRGRAAGGLVRTGYALSNLGRPLLSVTTAWPMVMLVRIVDRLGKGLRSAPRDALIATSVTSAERGLAFGVQRSMDHAGAVLGPLLAAVALGLGASVPAVFALSAFPGAILLLMLWQALPGGARTPTEPPAPLRFSSLDGRLWGLLLAVTLLAFAAVPEAFMMIYAREHGLAIAALPLLWAAMSVAKMIIAIPAGLGADRYGRMPMLALAWSLRVLVLAGLAATETSQIQGIVLVLSYGACLALAEPAERSLIADVAPTAHRGTLYGAYYLLSGLAVLPGAVVFGGLWTAYGSSVALTAAAVMTAVAALGMGVVRRFARPPSV